MAKIMLHDAEARAALGKGVAKLACAVRGTPGSSGMNVIIDQPTGTPMISRDTASIANEIELEDPLENIGVQVLREASKQTNPIAGDGAATATVLADRLVQQGLALAVASAAANEKATGRLVAEPLQRVGATGMVAVECERTAENMLDMLDGMSLDRGYCIHRTVTDVEKMQVVLDHPFSLMTDHKLQSLEEVTVLQALIKDKRQPLLIIAEAVAPACVVALLAAREKGGWLVAAIHPPEYGHWRKSMRDDIAITTGGRVVARDLGGRIDAVQLRDLGSAKQVRLSANQTVISGGGGDAAAITAWRPQVERQYGFAPPIIERDKFQVCLAKRSGGTALILVGGATSIKPKRRLHLIEHAIKAARAALADGVVPDAGATLLQMATGLAVRVASTRGRLQQGVKPLQRALAEPPAQIAHNRRLDSAVIVARAARAARAEPGVGLDARSGERVHLAEAGIIDPVLVSCTAVRNAASVAGLILTTQTPVASKPATLDPTAGRAEGGGAQGLGRA